MSEARFENVCSDTSEEFDSDTDSDYVWNPLRKISKKIIKKPSQKQYISSGMTEQFQNSCTGKIKMAAANNREVSLQNLKSRMDNNQGNGRRRKCFTKNALMARENRLKKKLYVQNLEESVDKYKDENKKLTSILNNQSKVITDLRKEVKYFKSILANSNDISRLLKCLNENTGMPVGTSLNTSLTVKSDKKMHHPWADTKLLNLDDNFDSLNGELPISSITDDLKTGFNWETLFTELNSPPVFDDCTKLLDDQLLKSFEDKEDFHEEHNYTIKSPENTDLYDNVGVCLHIAQHKVSLEFCTKCNEKASTVWHED